MSRRPRTDYLLVAGWVVALVLIVIGLVTGW
jgi:hypothetical protein